LIRRFFTIARERTSTVASLSSSFYSVAELIELDIRLCDKGFASKWMRINRTSGGVKSKLSIDDEGGKGKRMEAD